MIQRYQDLQIKMPGTAFMHFYVPENDGTRVSLFKLFATEALPAKEEVFMRAYEPKDIVKVATLTNGVLPEAGGLTDVNIATIKKTADLYAFVKESRSSPPRPKRAGAYMIASKPWISPLTSPTRSKARRTPGQKASRLVASCLI